MTISKGVCLKANTKVLRTHENILELSRLADEKCLTASLSLQPHQQEQAPLSTGAEARVAVGKIKAGVGFRREQREAYSSSSCRSFGPTGR